MVFTEKILKDLEATIIELNNSVGILPETMTDVMGAIKEQRELLNSLESDEFYDENSKADELYCEKVIEKHEKENNQ